MAKHNVGYTLGFAAVVCLVCSILVTSSAVSLNERQEINKALDKKKNVLEAAGLKETEEELTEEEIDRRFEPIRAVAIDLESGEIDPEVDPLTYDYNAALLDSGRSKSVERNLAQITRVANAQVIYQVLDDAGQVEMLVLPIEGKGLWSTLKGFIALSDDLQTIEGLTFYEHKETPGLGGEVDNPRWKALWPGRKAFDQDWNVQIEVIKGQAGPVAEDPYRVDGLSGATITARGVSHMLDYWLGANGYGAFLERYRAGEIQVPADETAESRDDRGRELPRRAA